MKKARSSAMSPSRLTTGKSLRKSLQGENMAEAPLWTGKDVIAAVAGKADRADWRANNVSIGSRPIEPGDLFLAIVGPVHDGHEFAADPAREGAGAPVVGRRPRGLPAG